MLGRDVPGRQRAEPGRDAVRRGGRRGELLDDRAGPVDRGQRVVGEAARRAVPGHRHHVLELQRADVDRDRPGIAAASATGGRRPAPPPGRTSQAGRSCADIDVRVGAPSLPSAGDPGRLAADHPAHRREHSRRWRLDRSPPCARHSPRGRAAAARRSAARRPPRRSPVPHRRDLASDRADRPVSGQEERRRRSPSAPRPTAPGSRAARSPAVRRDRLREPRLHQPGRARPQQPHRRLRDRGRRHRRASAPAPGRPEQARRGLELRAEPRGRQGRAGRGDARQAEPSRGCSRYARPSTTGPASTRHADRPSATSPTRRTDGRAPGPRPADRERAGRDPGRRSRSPSGVTQDRADDQHGAKAVADGLNIALLPTNTTVRVAHAAAQLATGVHARALPGFVRRRPRPAPTTRRSAAVRSPLLEDAVPGHRRRGAPQDVAGRRPACLARRGRRAHPPERARRPARAPGLRGGLESPVDLGGSRCSTGIVGRVNVDRTDDGPGRADTKGTTIGSATSTATSLRAARARRLHDPRPGRVDTNVTRSCTNGIDVVAVRLTLPRRQRCRVDLGHARLQIARHRSDAGRRHLTAPALETRADPTPRPALTGPV